MASGGASMGIDLAMRSFATDGQVPITVDGFRVGIGGWVGVLHGFYRKKKDNPRPRDLEWEIFLG